MECPVCYEELTRRVRVTTPCEHVVCLRCFLRLRPPRCPLCRTDLAAHVDAPSTPTAEVTLHVSTSTIDTDPATDIVRQAIQRMRVMRDMRDRIPQH
jgi:hypothetical protein